MGLLLGIAAIGVNAWNAWNAWTASQERIKAAKQAQNATIAYYQQQLAEQKKMEAYFSYGVLGIGIVAFVLKEMR